MTDLTIFRPLYDALVSALEETRTRAASTPSLAGYRSSNSPEQTAARRALQELVPHERNMRKMFNGLKAKELGRYRWAGHQFVAYLVSELIHMDRAADSDSPAWNLPLTPELVCLVLPGAEAHKEAFAHEKCRLTPAHVELMRALQGSTVRDLADDLAKRRMADRRSRLELRAAALDLAKKFLTAQELDLLLDKSLY